MGCGRYCACLLYTSGVFQVERHKHLSDLADKALFLREIQILGKLLRYGTASLTQTP